MPQGPLGEKGSPPRSDEGLDPTLKQNIDPSELSAIMSEYCDLMTEIKIRNDAISATLRSQSPDRPPAQIVYENCHLQFRMICELIALGCLVVHRDINMGITNQMQAIWNADKIIKRLSRVNPHFYPQPVILHNNTGELRYEFIQSDYLTKQELRNLYNIVCGTTLHRGTIADMRRRFDPTNVRFDEVERWRRKIVRLLGYHWISVHGSPDQIAVSMNDAGSLPTWTYFKAVRRV